MNTTTVSEYDDNEIVNPSHNAHIGSMLAARLSRRSALKGSLGATSAALLGAVSLSACGGSDSYDIPAPPIPEAKRLNFNAVAKTNADLVTVPEGTSMPAARRAVASATWRAASAAVCCWPA